MLPFEKQKFTRVEQQITNAWNDCLDITCERMPYRAFRENTVLGTTTEQHSMDNTRNLSILYVKHAVNGICIRIKCTALL